jgi:predicted CopG family antitoxin
MKITGTLFFLFFLGFTLQAQDITGIWRGYFNSGYGSLKQHYKYEVQINQLSGKRGPGNAKAIKGVTYSYRLKSFYGKARFVGIYNDQTKEITLKEDTLVEIKMDAESFSCLMTCYLAYHKVDNTEVLQGSFSSVESKSGRDCPGGNIYLERVQESDFHKEDFLLKKRPGEASVHNKPHALTDTAKAKVYPPAKPATVDPSKKTTPPAVKTTPPKKPQPPAPTAAKPPAAPSAPAARPADSTIATSPLPPAPPAPVAGDKMPPVPDVIKERTNPLVKTLVTNSPDIKIELYDNGDIDGDTITVYHNNIPVAFKRGLSTKPITINIKASATDKHHEFIMVADNLGTLPPNTALMVITTGGKRYELFISSDEKRNAKVVIDYSPPGGN